MANPGGNQPLREAWKHKDGRTVREKGKYKHDSVNNMLNRILIYTELKYLLKVQKSRKDK